MFESGAIAPALGLAAAVTTPGSASVTRADLANRRDHILDVLIAELRRARERQGARAVPRDVLKVLRTEAEPLAVVVVQMDGGVVDAGAHIPPDQLVQHLVTALADLLGPQEYRVQVPRMNRSGLDRRGADHRQR